MGGVGLLGAGGGHVHCHGADDDGDSQGGPVGEEIEERHFNDSCVC